MQCTYHGPIQSYQARLGNEPIVDTRDETAPDQTDNPDMIQSLAKGSYEFGMVHKSMIRRRHAQACHSTNEETGEDHHIFPRGHFETRSCDAVHEHRSNSRENGADEVSPDIYSLIVKMDDATS
jgi:hypothetical protein